MDEQTTGQNQDPRTDSRPGDRRAPRDTRIPATLSLPEAVPCPYQPGWYWIAPQEDMTANLMRTVPVSPPDSPVVRLELVGATIDPEDPEDTLPLTHAHDEIYRGWVDVKWDGCVNVEMDGVPHFCQPERALAYARGLLAAQRLGHALIQERGAPADDPRAPR